MREITYCEGSSNINRGGKFSTSECNELLRAVLNLIRHFAGTQMGERSVKRKLFMLAIFGLISAVTVASAEDEKKPDAKPAKGKLDKTKMFEKMDANGDGKVTKEEFKTFSDALKDRLKDKGGKAGKVGELIGDKLFDKMDANADGEISKEEFDKFEFPGKKK